MNTLNYIKGDATEPVGEGNKIVAHIVNNIGAWGAGFVLAVSKKWPEPEDNYKMYTPNALRLGTVDYILVDNTPFNNIYVANMIAQHGIKGNKEGIPLRYSSLVDCLRNLNEMADHLKASIHMPMIGSGLAGGDWAVIEQIIRECTTVSVNIYYL